MPMDFKKLIRNIPDFPKKGVQFKDFTPLLANARAFSQLINQMAAPFRKKKIDKVVGIDARGFLLAAPVAYKLKVGMAIVRKKGKLPLPCFQESYEYEYSKDTLEIHQDALLPDERVLIVDDLLATGSTLRSTINLVKKLQGRIVGIAVLGEMKHLHGYKKLRGYFKHVIITFDD